MNFLDENIYSMESFKSLFSSAGHTWMFRICTSHYSMNCYLLSNYVVTVSLIPCQIYSVLHYTVKTDQINWCESLQQSLGSFWESKAAWWWLLTFTWCCRFGRTRAVPQWEHQGILWVAMPAMLEVKAGTVKLFRLEACTLYSHFEDQGTERTRCQKHRGNNGMTKCTGLNYSIQGQMLGFYVLGAGTLIFMKEGSLLRMKSSGRKVMSCRWVSSSHYSPGITILSSGSSHPTVQHHIPEDSCIFSNITIRDSDLTTHFVRTW